MVCRDCTQSVRRAESEDSHRVEQSFQSLGAVCAAAATSDLDLNGHRTPEKALAQRWRAVPQYFGAECDGLEDAAPSSTSLIKPHIIQHTAGCIKVLQHTKHAVSVVGGFKFQRQHAKCWSEVLSSAPLLPPLRPSATPPIATHAADSCSRDHTRSATITVCDRSPVNSVVLANRCDERLRGLAKRTVMALPAPTPLEVPLFDSAPRTPYRQVFSHRLLSTAPSCQSDFFSSDETVASRRSLLDPTSPAPIQRGCSPSFQYSSKSASVNVLM
eukprot:Filipodium_phascolosomae@DN1354_c0_g1_i1.p1